MRAVILWVLAGCNSFYGLDSVKIVDAQVFDGPSMCSPFGASFDFSATLDQLLYDCESYTEAGDLAIALCREQDGYQPHGGPPQGPFAPIAELPRTIPGQTIRNIQLAADGTLLTMAIVDDLRAYQLVDGVWTRGADIPLPPSSFASNVSRAPDRRILHGQTTLHELSDASGSWQDVRMHSLAASDVASAVPVWLSGDALRLLVLTSTTPGNGERHIRYSERATTADAFQSLRILTLPPVGDVFITDDCARAYFSGLRSIFYAHRL